jgi:hypothetical protein
MVINLYFGSQASPSIDSTFIGHLVAWPTASFACRVPTGGRPMAATFPDRVR